MPISAATTLKPDVVQTSYLELDLAKFYLLRLEPGMQTVNMHEAKSQLSALVNAALNGEEVVIAKAGNPLVRLVPFREQKTQRQPGRLKGQIKIAPDFDEIGDEIVEMFEQGR